MNTKAFVPLKPADKKLRQKCERVTLKELKTPEFQKLIDKLMDFVYGNSNKGESSTERKPMTVGLSANQVGVLKQISIVDLAIANNDANDIHVLINPRIVKKSRRLFYNREGCVNLPEIWGLVPRAEAITVKALDRSGNKITIEAKGWTSVLLQHEIDHLKGYLFIDRLLDPKHAHFVKDDNMEIYRGHEWEWDKFVDVTKLLRDKELKAKS